MEQIDITLKMLDNAREKAEEMGALKNSIRFGRGNLVGFVGEEVAAEFFRKQKCVVKHSNTYDYDLIVNDVKIDVKSKQCNSEPLPHYDCSVAKLNTKQKCDFYVFVRVQSNLKRAWILGGYPKTEYLEKATFLEKGQLDPRNNYTCKSTCYNMEIKDLIPESELKKKILAFGAENS